MYGDLTENSPKQGFHSIKTVKNYLLHNPSKPSADIELCSKPELGDVESSAVVVRNACKSYGKLNVLHYLNMTVPKGVIYGLLGASGCGKTTLLGSITGRNVLHYGDIYVLGKKLPNTNNITRIGYMPQATGLYGEFTIFETLLFFGRVIGMEETKIKERITYLINLLMLPQSDYSIKNLSTGQQRRVSLAVAFLHEPELLILDEPTVGVDSILRQLIWNHFLNLTRNGDVTIIITTHYIEEACQANLIGIMRGGCLMAEKSPDILLREHQTNKLEEVFLKLSVLQNQGKLELSHNNSERTTIQSISTMEEVPQSRLSCTILKGSHMKALVWKNILWLRKNLTTLIVVTLLPVAIVSLFCVAIGHDPADLKVAVVNLEVNARTCRYTTIFCESEELGCFFLKYLKKRGLLMKYYSTEDDAIDSVKKGETYASIIIKQNYSSALRKRAYDWKRENDQSVVDVFRDLSNKHLAIYIQVIFYEAFENFFNDFVDSCNIPKNVMKIPMRLESVYGWANRNFTDFSVPGLLLSVVFIIGVILTSWAMLIERNEASLERSLVMGINKIELLTAHIIVECGIMFTQTVLTMICTFLVFKMTMKGSLILTTILLALTGFCGICYGLLVSCITNTQIGISLIAIGTYFTVILTSGLIWPLEAMHWLLKPFVCLFPLTKPTESLRNILHRDWSILRPDVYIGFISISFWALIFLLCSIILIKLQKT